MIEVTVRRMGNRIRTATAWDGLTQLAVLGACFAAGALGGFFFSSWSGNNTDLLDYLNRYFQMAGQGGWVEPSLWASIWELVRWPLAAFLLGASGFGVVGIPALLAFRGFLLAYATTIFARLFGLPGVSAALAAFGVTALVAVPVLFVVSVDAFCQSLGRLSGERLPSLGQRTQSLSPCAGLMVLAVALQQTLMPALFTTVCARLFIS